MEESNRSKEKIDYSNKKLNIVFNDKSIDITNLKLKYPEKSIIFAATLMVLNYA